MLFSDLEITAWKVFKYGVFSGPYFPVFGLNIGKYEPEKTPYWDTFHVVNAKCNGKTNFSQKKRKKREIAFSTIFTNADVNKQTSQKI